MKSTKTAGKTLSPEDRQLVISAITNAFAGNIDLDERLGYIKEAIINDLTPVKRNRGKQEDSQNGSTES